MTKWRLKKDLPGAKAGTVAKFKEGELLNSEFAGIINSLDYMKKYPDFFEEIKEPTLEEAVERLLLAIPTWPTKSVVRARMDFPTFWNEITDLRIAYERHMKEKEGKCNG